MFTKVRGKR